MRIACILIDHLPVQVERKGQHDNKPLIIGGLPFERKLVYDASVEAIECGVTNGMSLAQAQVLCPEAEFLPLEEKKYREAHQQATSELDNFSPIVEIGELGCAFLGVIGQDDELALAGEVNNRLFCHTGLRACIGIAGNKFLAKIAAHVTRPEAPIIVAKGTEKEFIAPFSVNFLPCSKKTKARLDLFGIRTIGQLAGFTREELLEQFDKEGDLLHEIAQAIDRTPIIRRKRAETMSKTVHFDTPVGNSQQLLGVIDRMVSGLLSDLKKEGKLCHKLILMLDFSSGKMEYSFHLKEASNSYSKIMTRLKSWLEVARFSEAIDGVGMCLEINVDHGRQLYLIREKSKEVNKLRVLCDLNLHGLKLKKVSIVDRNTLIPEHSFNLIEQQELNTWQSYWKPPRR